MFRKGRPGRAQFVVGPFGWRKAYGERVLAVAATKSPFTLPSNSRGFHFEVQAQEATINASLR